ncbi:hypothetical protein GXP67_21125 [Rhodocytophaga rosea]|uniref:Uncharacterized protein n=1 Tax=Rhodocytophaga rosea TaxID=2704465 RepID=A0A6C0GMW0_9BACT|nr:hypothetical protein [Rhodocytophaga rosea]QHT68973.1 hypothetical protein GXP67_21125 [Rhodocytophaga rosea]
MNQGYDNALLSPGRDGKDIYNSLKQQFPAEALFLEKGTTYRPIKIGLDQLQLIAKALKGGYGCNQ